MRLFWTAPAEPSAEELAAAERLNAIAGRGKAERSIYPIASEAAAKPPSRPRSPARSRKTARR